MSKPKPAANKPQPEAAQPEAAQPEAAEDPGMTEVILTISLAGPVKAYGKGDPFPCSLAEARRLRDAGYAEPA